MLIIKKLSLSVFVIGLAFFFSCSSSETDELVNPITFAGAKVVGGNSATVEPGEDLLVTIFLQSPSGSLESMTLTASYTDRNDNPQTDVLAEIERTSQFDSRRSHSYQLNYPVPAEQAGKQIIFDVELTYDGSETETASLTVTVNEATAAISFFNTDGTPYGDAALENTTPSFSVVATASAGLKEIRYFRVMEDGTETLIDNIGTFDSDNQHEFPFNQSVAADVSEIRFEVEDQADNVVTRSLFITTRLNSRGTHRLGDQSNTTGSFLGYNANADAEVFTQAEATANSEKVVFYHFEGDGEFEAAIGSPQNTNTAENPYVGIISGWTTKLQVTLKRTSADNFNDITNEYDLQQAYENEGNSATDVISQLADGDVFLAKAVIGGEDVYMLCRASDISNTFVEVDVKY